SRSRSLRISRAWISMSVAWPWMPPHGWWIMILLLGRAYRRPLAPAARRNAPMDAASPTQMVLTSGLISLMVSWMAKPAVTLPPGLLMYRLMWALGSWASKKSSWATTRFATWSVMGPPKKMIRSLSRRE